MLNVELHQTVLIDPMKKLLFLEKKKLFISNYNPHCKFKH